MANDTRTRMLDAAEDLLQDRGYHGLALAELLDRSSAPRGSLYFHFPEGKDQLVATATRDGVERVTESLRSTLAGTRSPGGAIRAILETSAAALVDTISASVRRPPRWCSTDCRRVRKSRT